MAQKPIPTGANEKEQLRVMTENAFHLKRKAREIKARLGENPSADETARCLRELLTEFAD